MFFNCFWSLSLEGSLDYEYTVLGWMEGGGGVIYFFSMKLNKAKLGQGFLTFLDFFFFDL